ncbi:MAG: response regulator [Chloroflexota bacterium]|nr:response regulator [Chloroflexota bacterium]
MIRILIAEDDLGIRSFLCQALSDEGYCVETAADGRIAVEMVAQALPDLLITDLLMPGLTGWSVLSRVRRQAPHLPILVISGAMTGVPPDTASLPNHTIFLSKPIMIDQLLTAIEQLLDVNLSMPDTLRGK